MYEPLDM